MFENLRHQGNANENYFLSLPHIRQRGQHQENKWQHMVTRMGEGGIFCAAGVWTVQPLWKLVWRFLEKKKNWNKTLHRTPATLLLGRHLTATKSACRRNACTAMFAYSTHNCQGMETDRIPVVDKWMEKMWYMYTKKFYTAAKRSKIITLAGKQRR